VGPRFLELGKKPAVAKLPIQDQELSAPKVLHLGEDRKVYRVPGPPLGKWYDKNNEPERDGPPIAGEGEGQKLKASGFFLFREAYVRKDMP